MRIIAGKYRGRAIRTLRLKDVRPTQDKVREALFNILSGRVIGTRFLDLFAGYGGVGLEALSRGAKEVIFVEERQGPGRIIQDNLESLGEEKNASVFKVDVLKAIEIFSRKKVGFDIIFADPPYYKGLSKKCLQKISACDIVTPDGVVVIQHYKKDLLPQAIGRISLMFFKSYGDSVLSIYSRTNA